MVRALVLVLALVASAGCHRVTYTTDRPLGRSVSVWNDYFALGLIGHAEIDARAHCPDGVARITTYQHVQHILLTVITVGIYAPRSVQLICAASPEASR